MRKLMLRYIIGLLTGVLIMSMGRYKIHGYHLLMLAFCIIYFVFDLLNEKNKC